MKKWQSASVIPAATLMAVIALCPPFALHAQPRLTDAQILALRATPPSLIPRSGNFWSVSRPTDPPVPFDPFPNLPAYILPDWSYLFDDSTIPYPPAGPISLPDAARSFLTQTSLANQQRLASLMLNEADVPGIPGSTNSPPVYYPPQLLSPPPPTKGTFWFLVNSNYPPMFYDPFPDCPVYLLTDGSYLIDDSSANWVGYFSTNAPSY